MIANMSISTNAMFSTELDLPELLGFGRAFPSEH